MTDPHHTSPTLPDAGPPPGDRDARIAELLVAGLDHYFAGRFQDAINVWGRVLFLDRGHARARAYIERARGALAERQRRSEELVQEGVAALERGDDSIARELLTSAVAHGDSPDVAQAYLDRLERLSTARAQQVREASGARRVHRTRGAMTARSLLRASARPVRALPILALAIVAVAAIVFAMSKDPLKPFVDLRLTRPAIPGAGARPAEALPVPRASELAIARARAMFGAGQLRPALAALDEVPGADPLAPEADRLRGEIQRALLGWPSAQGARADNPSSIERR